MRSSIATPLFLALVMVQIGCADVKQHRDAAIDKEMQIEAEKKGITYKFVPSPSDAAVDGSPYQNFYFDELSPRTYGLRYNRANFERSIAKESPTEIEKERALATITKCYGIVAANRGQFQHIVLGYRRSDNRPVFTLLRPGEFITEFRDARLYAQSESIDVSTDEAKDLMRTCIDGGEMKLIAPRAPG